MKHVVIITSSYPQSSDGSEAAGAFVKDFARCLAEHCEVTVVAPGKEAGKPDSDRISHSGYWAPDDQALSTLKLKNPVHLWFIVRILCSGISTVYELHKSEKKIDFVFCLWVFPCGFWGAVLARLRKIQYGTWALGSDIWKLTKIPVVRGLVIRTLKNSKANFADGIELAQEVEKISDFDCTFMASSRKIAVLDKTLKESGPYTLGYLGRWHENKGIDILLDALVELDDKDWANIEKVVIAGGGPLDAVVRTGVEHLKRLNRPVDLHGYLDQEEAAQFFQTIDYCLLPSRIESIPVVFSDALKNSCPVIAMPVGDIPVLIKKYKCGELAGNVSVEAYIHAVRGAFSKNLTDYLTLKDDIVELFSMEKSIQLFLSSIEQ